MDAAVMPFPKAVITSAVNTIYLMYHAFQERSRSVYDKGNDKMDDPKPPETRECYR